jgi:hypothetical protein
VDRFDSVRVFAKVVESSCFSSAAARLDISASMITLHVKDLEERLGVRLLNRTTRKVSRTAIEPMRIRRPLDVSTPIRSGAAKENVRPAAAPVTLDTIVARREVRACRQEPR